MDRENIPQYRVGELSSAIKRSLEDRFGVIRVRGEISGWKRASSGHAYFCLKDQDALIDSVMWRGKVQLLPFRPDDGLEVVATGKLTTFPNRSKYQIVIDRMEPAGVGALMAMVEARRKALKSEGLFDPDRKRKIPKLPRSIGIVTSSAGAVIRDILHRLDDRFPRPVFLWDVAVQGVDAAGQIAQAIGGFNSLDDDQRPDVLIVARGGGSIEDLMAFNEEIVVRAVADSGIPVISAVGHESDTTLIDYAADLRAPTPTAAAEFAVPVRRELLDRLSALGQYLDRVTEAALENHATQVRSLARAMQHPGDRLLLSSERLDKLWRRLSVGLLHYVFSLRNRLADQSSRLHPAHLESATQFHCQSVAHLVRRLDTATAEVVSHSGRKVEGQGRMLESLGYQATLRRGYTVVRGDGALLSNSHDARRSGVLEIEFANRDIHSVRQKKGP